MKIETAILQEAVKRAIHFTTPVSTMPICTHFLLDTREGTLKIGAFDFEGSCLWDTRHETDEQIYVTVPAKLFHGDVIGIKEETVDLSIDKNKLIVKTERHRARFDTLSGDQFANLTGDYNFYPVNRAILNAFERCAVAISLKHSMAILGGVHLRVNNGNIEAYGTDGVRAGCYTVAFDDPNPSQTHLDITVPKKPALNIAKSAAGEGPLYFATDRRMLAIKTDDAIFTSQLLDGKYPGAWTFFERSRDDYSTVKVSGGALSEALRRVMVFSKGMEGYIILKGAKDALVVRADDSQNGSSQVEIDAVCTKPFEMAINIGYLYDFVTLARSIDITLWICGKRDAIYVSGLDNFDYLMMPMEIR